MKERLRQLWLLAVQTVKRVRFGPQALAWAGYLSFFLVCFVFFAYLTFPYDRLRTYLENQVSTPGGLQLRIEEMDSTWLGDIEMNGVQLFSTPDDPEQEPVPLEVDYLSLDISLLSLLFGGTSVDFDASLGRGHVEGEFEQDEESLHLEAEPRSIDIADMGLGGLAGIPLKGTLDGEIDLDVGPEDREGAIELTIKKLVVGDGKAKLKVGGMGDGITVETINAGDLVLKMSLKNNALVVDELEASGPDVKLTGDGQIRLPAANVGARADMNLSFRFTEAYKNRDNKTRALFELASFNPKMKRAMSSDGTFNFRIHGPVSDLRADPGRTRRASSPGKRNPRRRVRPARKR